MTKRPYRSLASPSTWILLAKKFAANPEFFNRLLHFSLAQDSDARRTDLDRLRALLYNKAYVGDVRACRHSLKGIAQTVAEANPWLQQQQASVHHLGALRRLCSLHGTRWDYTLLISKILLDLKEQCPGLGLGSVADIEWDCQEVRKPTRMELAQAWALLANSGHLFGTFATERALQYQFAKTPSLSTDVLKQIDPSLRQYAEELLDRSEYHSFFYVLACWRISVETSGSNRSLLLAIFRSFFEERGNEDAATGWAYRTARQLAYNRMHLYLQAGTAPDVVHALEVGASVVPYEELGFEEQVLDEDGALRAMLAAFDAYQLETFFTGRAAATAVLQHLREFKQWWEKRAASSATLSDTLRELFVRPADWPVSVDSELQHFVRLQLPVEPKNWVDEVRAWEPESSLWHSSNFLVSPGMGAAATICDVYGIQGRPGPGAVFQTATRLAEHSVASWSSEPEVRARRLWRSVARFGLRVLGLVLKPGVPPTMDPIPLGNGHSCYALVAPRYDMGVERVRMLVAMLPSEARKRELEAVLHVCSEQKQHAAKPWLLLLGQTYTLDLSGKRGHEIDGAWCYFQPNRVEWYFLEHKKKAGTAKSQLTQLMSDVLEGSFTNPTRVNVPSGKSYVGSARWPLEGD